MGKLSGSLIVIVILGVVSIGWGISHYYDRYINEEESTDVEFLAYQHLGRALAQTLPVAEAPETLIRTINQDKNIAVSLTPISELSLPDQLVAQILAEESVALESEASLSFYFLSADPSRVLVLEISFPPEKNSQAIRLFLTLLFYFGVVAVIVIWLTPFILRLKMLHRATRAFGAGDLSARVKEGRYSYISDIETEFNRMADRILSLVNDNKLLSRAVSHDLKTPLARLRFGFETLIEAKTQEQREKFVERLEGDLDEMESLVETLLEYAQMDEAHINLNKKELSLHRMCEQLLKPLYSDIETQYIGVPEAMVFGDEKYLRMLLQNLISNAVQYCAKSIRLELIKQTDAVVLTIEDDGPGIPKDLRDHVIKPFVRGEAASSSTKKGHGMGLAIVHRIVEWHSGRLVIDESPSLKGARITVIFQQKPTK